MNDYVGADPVLTEAAQAKVKELIDREGRDDLMLRLSVQPGGCSGLRYQLFFDSRELEGDNIFEQDNGTRFVIDRMSMPYLAGATIKWQDELMATGFQIDNPNAEGSCACGDSFH